MDLSNFDTSKVNDMGGMFNECYKLKSIKGINKFKTNEVTTMNTMFQNCKELEELDLSNFDTSKVSNNENMLLGSDKLKLIFRANDEEEENKEEEEKMDEELMNKEEEEEYEGQE